MNTNFVKTNLPMFGFLLYLLFVAPAIVYYFNPDEFSFSLLELSLVAGVISLLSIVGLYFLNRYFPAATKWLNYIALLLLFYLSIVNFLLPINIGELDGENKTISTLFSKHNFILIAKYALVFLGILLVAKYYYHIMRSLVLTIVLIGVGFYSFAVLTDKTSMQYIEMVKNRALYLENFYQVSDKENVFIIGFDAIQGSFLYEVLQEHPEYAAAFDGFTFYKDANSVAHRTILSVMTMIAGFLPDEVPNKEESYMQKVETNNLLIDMMEHDYTASFYGVNQCQFLPALCLGKNYGIILDMPLEILITESKSIYYFSLLRAIPYPLIATFYKVFYFTTPYDEEEEHVEVTKKIVSNDPGFSRPYPFTFLLFRDLLENMYVTPEEGKQLKLHHYTFTHPPVKFNSACHYSYAGYGISKEAAKDSIQCALKQMMEFIEKLKELGIYDQSLIIFTSDHGFSRPFNQGFNMVDDMVYYTNKGPSYGNLLLSRYNIMFLYKPFHARGNLLTSDRPTSALDVRATLAAMLNLDNELIEGISLDEEITLPRERDFMVYDGIAEKSKTFWENQRSLNYLKTVSFDGTVYQLPYLIDPPIAFDDVVSIDFTAAADHNKFIAGGLLEQQGATEFGAPSLSNKVWFSVKMNTINKETPYTIVLQATSIIEDKDYETLIANVFVNNQLIDSFPVAYDRQGPQPQTMQLTVPGSLLAEKEWIDFRIEILEKQQSNHVDRLKDKVKLNLVSLVIEKK